MDVIPNRNQILNWHISKIRFLFPVSFTIEYKVWISEIYLYMGFAADLLKYVVCNIGIRTPLKLANYFRFASQTIAVEATTFLSHMQNFDFYFRFHSPLNTKSALLSFICLCNLVLICWKMWSPEPENCQNRNPHTSKIGKLLPVCLTNNRWRCDHISELHAKFCENR